MPAPEEAVEALWTAWHRHVLAYALRRTDPATAEDVVAETFVTAWRRLDAVPDRPLPWLLGVARRLLANQRRAQHRREALVERIAGAAGPASEHPDDGRVLAALQRLNERDREALLLHAWEGLDHTDAATVLGCSAATFAVRLHRARKRFASALDAVAEQEAAPR